MRQQCWIELSVPLWFPLFKKSKKTIHEFNCVYKLRFKIKAIANQEIFSLNYKNLLFNLFLFKNRSSYK
ncbi:MAG: hypothetical protein CK425_04655 [Parachlamydia sp.]|nr:MAG: hypothetical protein CK425_04655 [Parachlamydia sp.]